MAIFYTFSMFVFVIIPRVVLALRWGLEREVVWPLGWSTVRLEGRQDICVKHHSMAKTFVVTWCHQICPCQTADPASASASSAVLSEAEELPCAVVRIPSWYILWGFSRRKCSQPV